MYEVTSNSIKTVTYAILLPKKKCIVSTKKRNRAEENRMKKMQFIRNLFAIPSQYFVGKTKQNYNTQTNKNHNNNNN